MLFENSNFDLYEDQMREIQRVMDNNDDDDVLDHFILAYCFEGLKHTIINMEAKGITLMSIWVSLGILQHYKLIEK